LIDKKREGLSIVGQCQLLSVSRSTYYYERQGESAENLELMRLIDEQYLKTPFYGSRQMTLNLRREGLRVNRKRVQRLMALMGLSAVYQRPRTSKPHPEHRVYLYLLRDLEIDRPDQAWCADLTYMPLGVRV
jgi:putative transposase